MSILECANVSTPTRQRPSIAGVAGARLVRQVLHRRLAGKIVERERETCRSADFLGFYLDRRQRRAVHLFDA
jgi:hypothetical protein